VGKIRVLARATLDGLAGWVVTRGPPVAQPCFRIRLFSLFCLMVFLCSFFNCLFRKIPFFTAGGYHER